MGFHIYIYDIRIFGRGVWIQTLDLKDPKAGGEC